MLINRVLFFPLSIILLLVLFSPMNLLADPWGKDADLVTGSSHVCITSSDMYGSIPKRSVFVAIGEQMIRFHQDVISPADGPRSHFIPSSSQYTLDAMRKYGFFRGYMMGCDRLMRENNDPWVYKKVIGPAGLMKWNPVP